MLLYGIAHVTENNKEKSRDFESSDLYRHFVTIQAFACKIAVFTPCDEGRISHL